MKLKKLIAPALALAMMVTTATPALAQVKEDFVYGYESFVRTLTPSRIETKVSRNDDNARLSVKYEVADKRGRTLASDETYSNRGEKECELSIGRVNDAYAIYGTHGIQGGWKYEAVVDYTYIRP